MPSPRDSNSPAADRHPDRPAVPAAYRDAVGLACDAKAQAELAAELADASTWSGEWRDRLFELAAALDPDGTQTLRAFTLAYNEVSVSRRRGGDAWARDHGPERPVVPPPGPPASDPPVPFDRPKRVYRVAGPARAATFDQ